jgi:hypothetical protein
MIRQNETDITLKLKISKSTAEKNLQCKSFNVMAENKIFGRHPGKNLQHTNVSRHPV